MRKIVALYTGCSAQGCSSSPYVDPGRYSPIESQNFKNRWINNSKGWVRTAQIMGSQLPTILKILEEIHVAEIGLKIKIMNQLQIHLNLS